MNIKEIEIDKPIGYLYHEYTKTTISVFKEISVFKKFMLRICFGLVYKTNI